MCVNTPLKMDVSQLYGRLTGLQRENVGFVHMHCTHSGEVNFIDWQQLSCARMSSIRLQHFLQLMNCRRCHFDFSAAVHIRDVCRLRPDFVWKGTLLQNVYQNENLLAERWRRKFYKTVKVFAYSQLTHSLSLPISLPSMPHTMHAANYLFLLRGRDAICNYGGIRMRYNSYFRHEMM